MSNTRSPQSNKPHHHGPRAKGQRVKRRQPRREGVSPPAVPRVSHAPPAGSAAGIEYHELIQTPGVAAARVVCTDYCAEQIHVEEVTDIAAFLAVHRPTWSRVRWIHVEGLQDCGTIRALAEKYQLHPLAIEDALDGHHRPKAEDYPGTGDLPGRLFVVARRPRLVEDELRGEQTNFFLGRNTLLSFQETRCPAMDEVRRRIESPRSRLRQNDVSFLLYALMDTIVDRFFPILDELSAHLERAEEDILTRPQVQSLHAIHLIKRDLLMVRRIAWPMRELVAQLQRERHECLSEVTQTYFRDVYDHCVQIIDLIETYREISSAVAETYVSLISNRTNEIMKVLTVIGTIFIPLTFLAGVYGMNMYIPENQWHYFYAAFWTVCLGITGLMLWRFRRGGWL
ncbi:MAG: magnesium/cobalt transporter CorA [Chromatiaceae bacterium]